MKLLAFVLAAAVAAQNPAPPETIIRLNVNLIQVDVTVTDGAGRHQEGLIAEDFEVF